MTNSLSGFRPLPPGFSPIKPAQSISSAKDNTESEFQAVNRAVIDALSSIDPSNVKPTKASGGHGGFYVAEVSIVHPKTGLQETKKLFLKPFDPCEFNNFDYIQKFCAGKEEDSVLRYMPRVYGQATVNVEGAPVHFMVMENLRSDGTKEWTQVADLKMTKGGQYNLNELWATGRTKGIFDQKLLTFQGAVAENFLTLHTNPIKRTTNAVKGTEKAFQKNLVKALDKMYAADRIAALKNLTAQLDHLASLINNNDSPMGFIGASVFIYVSGNEFKIYLADPAHGIAQPWAKSLQTLSNAQKNSMYWGGEYDSKGRIVKDQSATVNAQFAQQKRNNAIAIQAMKREVENVIKSLLPQEQEPAATTTNKPSFLANIKKPEKSAVLSITTASKRVFDKQKPETSSPSSDTSSSGSVTSSASSEPTSPRTWKTATPQNKPKPNDQTQQGVSKPPLNTPKWFWPTKN